MYQILKDFAGPVATIIASITAALITYYFSSRQAQIAKQQADTALDQLRYNLFEKQYGIYETTKEMIKYIISECSTNNMEASFKIAARATGAAPGEILSQIKRLVELLGEMPSLFEKGLGFPQLTQRP